MQESLLPLKILWMIPKWTLPATDGARVATDSLIRNTIAAGAEVDVMCISQLSEKTDSELMRQAWGVKKIMVFARSLPEGGTAKILYYFWKLAFTPFTPLTFASFSEKKLKLKVRKHIKNNHYNIILLDGLHLGALLIENDKFHEISKNAKIILRAHNVEVDLWKKAYQEKKSPVLKFILFFQARLVQKFEKLIFDNCQGVAAISQEDLVGIKITSKTKSELVPLGLNFDNPLDACQETNMSFLFIGKLDWPPNRDGLEWILKEVWPTVIKNRPKAVLKIVGSGKKDWLKNYQNLKGVKIIGFVDSLRDAYQDCHFSIVPITYGSGTRIKVLESFALGRRLISTKMGVQGADLNQNDYVNAETKEEWINTLSTICFNEYQQDQLHASRVVMAYKFGEKQVGAKFYQWLKTIS